MKKFKKIFLILFVIIAVFSIATPFVFAQDIEPYTPLSPLPGTSADNGTTVTNFGDYISGVFKLVIGLAVVFAVFMVILAGVQYMTSTAVGSKGAARTRINNALFGLGLALLSWMLLNTINPNLVNFSLDFRDQIDNVNVREAKPENAGWYYFVSKDIAEEDGTINKTYSYIGRGVNSGGSVGGFYKEDACESAKSAEERRRDSPYTVFDIPCEFIEESSGPWFFEYQTGRGAFEQHHKFGYFQTPEKCGAEVDGFRNSRGDSRLVEENNGKCFMDVSKVNVYIDPGWYFVFEPKNTTRKIGQGGNLLNARFTERECNVYYDEITNNPTQKSSFDTKYRSYGCFYINETGITTPPDIGSGGGNEEEGIGNELEVRELLENIGVSINHDNYCLEGQTSGCTDVRTLPSYVVDGLERLTGLIAPFCDNDFDGEIGDVVGAPSGSNVCTITITGGTEGGHQTHGRGIAIIDLRTWINSNGVYSALERFLANYKGDEDDVLSGNVHEFADGYTVSGVNLSSSARNTYAKFVYEDRRYLGSKLREAHWHVIFE